MISISFRTQLIFCLLILCFESAFSQTVMRVHRNDSSVVEIPTEDIRTVKYTTLDYDLLSQFSAMEIRHVKATSAHIHFNVSTKSEIPIKRVGVCWDTFPSPTIFKEAKFYNNPEHLGETHFMLAYLYPAKKYYARAFLTDSFGRTEYSEELAFNTLEGTYELYNPSLEYSHMETTERNYVKTVKIGNQIWTADNLDTRFFKNGDAIPIAKDVKDWEKAQIEEQPVMLYMNFDENKKSKYGAYYNYFAIRDKRGLCPPGFRLPDVNDWEALYDHLKSEQGTALKSKLGWVDITDWDSGSPGDNRSGFSALPSGFYSGVGFHDEGYSTLFPIFPNSGHKSAINLYYTNSKMDFYGDLSWKGICVRCIHESFKGNW